MLPVCPSKLLEKLLEWFASLLDKGVDPTINKLESLSILDKGVEPTINKLESPLCLLIT
jgi:hypothetical protein